jgi:hypothetical protein
MDKQAIHNYELYWTHIDVPTPGTYVLAKKNRFTEWLIHFLLKHNILIIGHRKISQCNISQIEWTDDIAKTITRQIKYLRSQNLEPTRIIIGRNQLKKLMSEVPDIQFTIPVTADPPEGSYPLFQLPITMTPFADGVLVI